MTISKKTAMTEPSDLSDGDAEGDLATRFSDRGNPQLDLIGMIYRLHGNLRKRFAGANAAAGLILIESHALGLICASEGGATVSQVGRELGYSRQSIQRAINKLEGAGLIEARPNPRHKRAPIFIATASGIEQLSITQASARTLADDLKLVFDDERADALMGELAALLEVVQTSRAA